MLIKFIELVKKSLMVSRNGDISKAKDKTKENGKRKS